MIGRDSRLSELIYNPDRVTSTKLSEQSTMVSTGCNTKTGLTLENLKLFDQRLQHTNSQFVPRMSRLMQNQRPTTEFSGKFSIFEALYELEVSGPSEKQATQPTQEEYHDILLENLLQVDRIEQEFGRVHLLVDRLMRPKSCEKLSQNSFLFQMKFAMLLSSSVQMKNSLIKYMEYESTDRPFSEKPFDNDTHDL